MIQFESEKIFIEHCKNCSSHNWCTNHDESKYLSYFESCKKHIKDLIPELEIIQNQIPVHLISKFTTTDSRPWEGKLAFPRLGSFEVYYKNKTVFSKLESGAWPQPSVLASKLNELIHSPKLPQINKEKTKKIPTSRKKFIKIDSSRQRIPRSTRSNQKRYKSTTPFRKEQKKHDFSVKNIDKKDQYEDEGFEKDSNESKESKDLSSAKDLEKRITKVYELNLSCGVISNKKINYVNKNKDPLHFTLVSSHPESMIIKEPSVTISPGEIGKFQLRFSPVSKPQTTEYLLTVENAGKPWESFKFIVNYE